MSKAKSSALDDASDRLARAFSAMEKAIKHRPAIVAGGMDVEAIQSWESHCATLESDLAGVRDELNQARAENAKLSNQLHALQQDYVELQKVAMKAADALDEKAAQLDWIES